MIRTALLRTRCGCVRYMEVNYLHRFLEIPLLPDFRDSILTSMETGAVEYEPLERRMFELDGQTKDGICIYTEVYPK